MKKSVLVALAATSCGLAAGQIQPNIVIQERDAIATLYATGEVISSPSETRWRYICGTDTAGLTNADLAQVMQGHYDIVAAADAGQVPSQVINTSNGRGGLNVIFNVSGSPPGGAAAALAECEQIIESNFSDPSTVVVSVSFQPLGSGVLGGTSSNYLNANWTNTRNGLAADADGDDTILSFLPTGTTIPVRYNASSTSVTNETRVFFTRANYKAAIGSVSGTDASITISTNFSFDYNPSNGVPGSSFSFQDVMIHEVGHAMGFTSGVDFRNGDMEALDIFRFQRTDGSNDYNPDTFAEFQTTPRTLDFNNLNDDANSDLIDASYRMSDGSPWQASHFREQGANIGLMDPALSGGLTYVSRGYYTQADINMFDAIGYDVFDGIPTVITQQPGNQTVCEGDTAQFSVSATGENLTYQWLSGDGVNYTPIPNATGSTLTLNNVALSDSLTFFVCDVSGSGGAVLSAPGLLLVNPLPAITSQPDSLTVTEGDPASFSVSTTAASSFQWRRNGVNIPGATSSIYAIASTTLADAGNYSVAVTNSCDTVVSNAATLTVEPAPSDCPADVNGDGLVSPADFNAWVIAFNNQAPECDQNGDGLCSPADFNAWVINFNAGCP